MSEATSNAVRKPYWFDTVPERAICPSLRADLTCSLAIVGGGFTGLWTAIKARERFPEAKIVLVEGGRCGGAASGRNGGFCAPSISHGIGNALTRWPKEAQELVRLGRENLDGYQADLEILGMEVEFSRGGKLNLAEKPWQVEGLRESVEAFKRFGVECSFLTGDELKEKFNSPVYSAGLFEHNYALVNPMKMVEGLRRVASSLDIEIYENTSVTAMKRSGDGVHLVAGEGSIQARQVVLATNAAPSLLKRFRTAVIPIFDYALMTRPLSEGELGAIGWLGSHGIADSGNRFHYVRKTADNRILWGGYDAIYHFGSDRDEQHLKESEVFDRLAGNFARALPQIAGVDFTHAWGGIIDTSARTTMFSGLAWGGRLAYAMGFTGQGVSATRFAALTMLDLLQGKETERTRLSMLRSQPVLFPPEPFRWLGVRWAQRGLAKEDETGRRSFLNKTLDRFGVGFDS